MASTPFKPALVPLSTPAAPLMSVRDCGTYSSLEEVRTKVIFRHYGNLMDGLDVFIKIDVETIRPAIYPQAPKYDLYYLLPILQKYFKQQNTPLTDTLAQAARYVWIARNAWANRDVDYTSPEWFYMILSSFDILAKHYNIPSVQQAVQEIVWTVGFPAPLTSLVRHI